MKITISIWKSTKKTRRTTPTTKLSAHHHIALSVPLRHAVPRHQQRRVYRGSNLQLDLFRRAARQGKLGRRADNPYAALPRMVMLTYQIPDSIRQIAMQGEFNEFDLNVFFSAKGKGKDAKFVYENEVQKWLDLIRGSYSACQRGRHETRTGQASADAVFRCAAC